MRHYVISDEQLESLKKLSKPIQFQTSIDRKRLDSLIYQCRNMLIADGAQTIEVRGYNKEGNPIMYKIYLEGPKILLCEACNGSGEGMRDGTICMECKGKGAL